MPLPGVNSEELRLSLNRAAVIEDFEIIGKGLVKEISVRTQDCLAT